MTWLLGAKAKLWALGGFLLAVLATIAKIKVLEHQRDKARAEGQVFKAERDRERDNSEISKLTREERQDEHKKAVKQIMAGEVPDSLGDGINDGWN